MIELSIVLLILSLLVGSLLVGRQIVDRAKIQRIIFEFDYYEKAFHQFYDTYKLLPGSMSRKTCLKYAEFSGTYKNYRQNGPSSILNYTHQQFCNAIANTNHGYSSTRKVMDNKNVQGLFYPMCLLSKAGVIEDISHITCWGNDNPITGATSWWSEDNAYRGNGARFSAPASFDNNLSVSLHGWSDPMVYEYKYNFLISNMVPNSDYETDDKIYRNALDGHNTVSLFGNDYACRCTPTQSTVCVCDKSTGALSSKMSSELDAKIDDGRPGTGKMVAFKGNASRRPGATKDEILQTCYDRPVKEVSKAIYHSDNNLKYGCNIIKVMEDVK